jgi:hypothetical protein
MLGGNWMRFTQLRRGESNSNKISFLALTCLLVIFVLLLIALFMKSKTESSNEVLGNVNGEPITIAEFRMRLNLNRAYTFEYFKTKYGVDDNKQFWTTSYGGENPSNIIKQKTLNELVRIKIEQIAAKEKGIVKAIDYTSFLNALQKENDRRKIAVQKREVIFGPTRYDEQGYYEYLHSNMVIALKGKLAETDLATDDTKLQDYYTNNRNQLFKNSDTITIQKISVSRVEGSSDVNEVSSEIAVIKDLINNGEHFDEILKKYKPKSPLVKAEFNEQTLDQSTLRTNSKFSPIETSIASKMSVGDVSEIFKEENSLIIMKCVARIDGGYVGFEEAKSALKLKILDDQYIEWISNKVNEASVETHKYLINKIKV